MKRSIDVEGLTVVIALGIVLSLIATACGPGKLKTLDSLNIQNKDKVEFDFVKAAQEKRTMDLNEGPQLPVDKIAVKDLAKRLMFVSLKKLTDTTANLTVQVTTPEGQPYYITFIEPHVGMDSKGKKVITFSGNIARKIINAAKVSETPESLPYSARILDLGNGRAIVSIYEKANKKTTEVAAMVRLQEAVATATPTDNTLAMLKDADYKIRITQLYVSDDNVLNGSVEYLDSSANRIVINAYSNSADPETDKTRELFSFDSKIDTNSNSTELKLKSMDESLRAALGYKKATLISADTLMKSDVIALQLTSKDDSIFNVTLDLVTEKLNPPSAQVQIVLDAVSPVVEDIKSINPKYEVSTETTQVAQPEVQLALPDIKPAENIKNDATTTQSTDTNTDVLSHPENTGKSIPNYRIRTPFY